MMINLRKISIFDLDIFQFSLYVPCLRYLDNIQLVDIGQERKIHIKNDTA